MFAARRQVARAARQLRRTARRHASDTRVYTDPVAEGKESFGKGSYAFLAFFFGGVILYNTVPRQGEESAITNYLARFVSKPEDWEEINQVYTRAMEQAGYDRNLFENASSKDRYFNVTYPEALQSYAMANNRAGHIRNLDHVVEHYRQQHIKDEERKAKNLAERRQ